MKEKFDIDLRDEFYAVYLGERTGKDGVVSHKFLHARVDMNELTHSEIDIAGPMWLTGSFTEAKEMAEDVVKLRKYLGCGDCTAVPVRVERARTAHVRRVLWVEGLSAQELNDAFSEYLEKRQM